eukprot:SAG11_NODE_1201_length_5538_cov_2.793896_3_plen_131_part_00
MATLVPPLFLAKYELAKMVRRGPAPPVETLRRIVGAVGGAARQAAAGMRRDTRRTSGVRGLCERYIFPSIIDSFATVWFSVGVEEMHECLDAAMELLDGLEDMVQHDSNPVCRITIRISIQFRGPVRFLS